MSGTTARPGSEGDLFQGWQGALQDSVYLGAAVDELDAEIRHNWWSLGASSSQLARTTRDDVLAWITRLIEDRRHKVRTAYPGRRAIFYLWFDEMAGQLQFNVISDCHSRLPFGSDPRLVASPRPVIEAFFESPCVDGIPLAEFRAASWEDPERFEPRPVLPPLDVYRAEL